MYTYEFLDIELPEKPEKRIALCDKCGESFVQKDGGALCLMPGYKNYDEIIRKTTIGLL